jgi:hypothetical protein
MFINSVPVDYPDSPSARTSTISITSPFGNMAYEKAKGDTPLAGLPAGVVGILSPDFDFGH